MYNCRNKQDMLITDLYRNTDVMPSIRVWSMFPMFPSSTSTLINIVRLVLYMFLREDECVIIWITRRVMMIVCAHLNMLRRERVGRGFGVWWLCHQQLIPSSVYARTYALIFRLSRFNHRQRPSSPNLMFLGRIKSISHKTPTHAHTHAEGAIRWWCEAIKGGVRTPVSALSSRCVWRTLVNRLKTRVWSNTHAQIIPSHVNYTNH